MQVIEIKNDLVQVRYNAEEQALSLGDFFVVSDNNADILAQIVHLETDEETALCLAKFILNINNDNSTSLYNGYMPSLDSVVSPVSKQEIIDFISPVSKGIKVGTLINSNLPVNLSESILDTPLYIQSDYTPACAKLLKLIFSENYTENNVIFYDIDGTFNDFEIPKFELGKDIKVPLNKMFMDFIYENDLNELNVSEKALVQDILLEIKEYIDTTDKDFIEFSTLLNVVNAQYEEKPSDALILFRNKLIEYKQLGFFADSQNEIDTFYNALNSKKAVISVFRLAKNWQYALCKFCSQSIGKRTHFICQISDTSVDESTINSILTSKFIIPVFVSSYSSKFRNLLRSKIPNMIFFQSVDELSDFPLYVNFLNLLFDNTYIIWGEITSFLSIIASYDIPQVISAKEIQKSETQNVNTQEFILPETPVSEPENNIESDTADEEETIFEEISDNIVEQAEEEFAENTFSEEEPAQADVSNNEVFEETPVNIEDDTFSLDELTNQEQEEESSEVEILTETSNAENTDAKQNEAAFEIIEDTQEENEPIQEDIEDEDLDFLEDEDLNNIEENFDDFAQEDPSENVEQTFEEEPQEELLQNEDEVYNEPENEVVDVIEETAEFTESQDDTYSEEETISQEDIQETSPFYEEEGVQSVEEEYEEIEEPKFSIPVYESEPQNVPDNDNPTPSFVEGNIVYHEKYGKGIIEKVISYGAKTLCSIQFDNIGRRLLDPNLADLKQI